MTPFAITKIVPLPERQGVGFSVEMPGHYIDVMVTIQEMRQGEWSGYRYERIGRYDNFYFTDKCWAWPIANHPMKAKIDGFSPNLNKLLHVGHLRNMAIAVSLSRMLVDSEFVALLGHSMGVKEDAVADLKIWFDFLGYTPKQFSDVDVSAQAGIEGKRETEGEKAGCNVWDGPHGPVIIRRSNGLPTYEMHDLAFAQEVKPDFYLTGAEQAEHFRVLGLGDRHLPMGLVLDPVTGKKMKSREGTAFAAGDAMALVMKRLDETPEPRKLAWNVIAWNFLHSGRTKEVKFNVDEWTRPESTGLYITYTHARIDSAIKAAVAAEGWHPKAEALTPDDVALLGFSAYADFYYGRATETLDPAPLANYAADLAKKLGGFYHQHMIVGGTAGLQYAVEIAHNRLTQVMYWLGMFPLTRV